MEDRYGALLAALAAEGEGITAEVVADVAAPGDDVRAVTALVRPAVDALLVGLAGGPGRPVLDAARLREQGVAAARRGEGVAGPIDRYLSAGWAIWDAATGHPAADGPSLAELGAALLRAGDAAAAAIAEGHGEAELEIARRTASARRAFTDDVLDLLPGDRDGLARLVRRAPGFGLDPFGRFAVFAAWLGRDIEDAGPEAERIDGALARPPRRGSPAPAGSSPQPLPPAPVALVAARHGRLVLVLPDERRIGSTVTRLIEDLADGPAWVAVRGATADGLATVAAETVDALAALAIVERRGPATTIVDVVDVALERALLADPVRLAVAVEHELGPLLRAPRGGAILADTVAAYLASRQNVQATARAMGVAPRTVTYRLGRVESLLGRRLDGPALRRLATALLARDLLDTTEAAAAP